MGAVTDTPPRFLDRKAVADELAVTERQGCTMLRTGDLPGIQVGPKKVWRIERVKLEECIKQRYAVTRAAVETGEVEQDATA